LETLFVIDLDDLLKAGAGASNIDLRNDASERKK
jgi:hypothetical protein